MSVYWSTSDVTLHCGDARTVWRDIEPGSAHAIVTSPPYFGLRDYGVDGQLGLEASPGEYVDGLADLLTDWGSSVLREDGSLWLNLGDTYAANRTYQVGQSKYGNDAQVRDSAMSVPDGWQAKCLLMIPERVALALIDRGWILRNRVVWAKPNGMPSSAKDRLATKHEAVFHFVRQQRYWYDLEAIKAPINPAGVRSGGRYSDAAKFTTSPVGADSGPNSIHGKLWDGGDGMANPGDVWTIPTQPYPDAHFAVFPPELVRRPILATVPEGGTVADPFAGAGTTAVMARRLGRRSLLCELNADYCDLIAGRLAQGVLEFEASP